MKQQEQDSIVYRVEALEDLVLKQQQALDMANDLLDMKNQLIAMCELETEIYKRQSKKLIALSAVIFAIDIILSIILISIS